MKGCLLIACFFALSTSAFGQVPLAPSHYNGNPNRTLNLKNPEDGSLKKPLEYDYKKFETRGLRSTQVPTERSCTTVEVEKDLTTKHAEETEPPEKFEQWMEETVKRTQRRRSIFRNSSQEVYSLPVVVHVVYSNSVENISDAQVMSQIEVLNQDYRRTNLDQSRTDQEFKNLAVDTGIEFCMATVDPQGNPTNGIDRISLSGSPFVEQTINEEIKPATIWDPNKYFNIWVLNIAEGVLGFAQFPMSSGLSGIPQLPATSQSDGVVINYFAFGTIGTVSDPFNKGRTATHEIGHWLGLRHVWGDGACEVDDFCGDTPPTPEAHFGCPTASISCDGTRAMVQNFMEYTNDACMNLFTRDQKRRMRTVLENSPRRKSLLTSNACKAVVQPPKAAFVANVQSGCGPLRVQFDNQSKGNSLSYAWSFSGGRPSSSNKSDPSVVFRKPGTYAVSLEVRNAGGSDIERKEGFIHVREDGIPLPFVQNFDTNAPLVGNGTQLHNPQNDHSWDINARVSANGQGKGSMTINNFDNNLKGAADWFLTPILDLSQESDPVLAFKIAYSMFSNRYSDTLGVFISTACDPQFRNIYFRGGAELSTTSPLQKPFTPREQEWRTEMIDLGQYRGQSHVQIAFVNFSGYGNDLYLDDIYIGKQPDPEPVAAFEINQTNLCAGDQVSFKDMSLHGPTKWIWSFDGGIPASDTSRNPIVSYPEPGWYDVKLTVRSAGGTDTEIRESVLFVKPKPNIRLIASQEEVCAGQEIQLSVSGDDSLELAWSLGAGDALPMGRNITLAPQEDALYTVTGTNKDGCQANSSISVKVREGQVLSVNPPTSKICKGESVRLVASGVDNYSWSPSTGLNSKSGPVVQADPQRTTTYTVTGRTSSGCMLRKDVTIHVEATPELVIDTDRETICPGTSAKLQASGAASYSWSPAVGLNSTEGELVSAAPSSTTTYTVTAATASGCRSSLKKTIEVGRIPRISLTASEAEICEGESIELRANGGAGYHWSPEIGPNPLRGAVIRPRPSTTTRFTVTGWNEVGCTDTTSVLIAVLPKPSLELEIDHPSICRGESTFIRAISPEASNYRWRPRSGLDKTDSEEVLASPRRATTYTVDIQDRFGCQNQASATVSISRGQRPIADFTATETVSCLGQEVQFQSLSEHAVEFFWEFPGGEPSFSREANPKVEFITLGLQDVRLTVEGCDGDRNSKEAPDFITISNPFEVEINTVGGTVCKGQSLDLIASGAEEYSWSPASGLDQTTGELVTATPTTSTTYKVVATDSDGCRAEQEIYLEVVGEGGGLNITPFSPAICEGESLDLAVRGAASYYWHPANGLERGVGSTVHVTPSQTTTYVVEGTTLDGCILIDSVEVLVREAPPLQVSPESPNLCPGDQISLTLNREGLFRWSPVEGLSAASGTEVVAFPEQTTTYTISGTDKNGCYTETQITVEVGNGLPLQVETQDSIICRGEIARLVASGGSGYVWFPADGLDQTTGPLVSARPEKTTTYTVSTQEGGCGSERSVTVVVRPPKAITINPSAPIRCEGDTVTLIASGGNDRSYVWDESEDLNTIAGSRVTVRPTATSSYTVRALDEDFCEMEGFVTVEVVPSKFLEISASTSTLCKGDRLDLAAEGADAYEWLAGNGINVRATAKTFALPERSGSFTVIGKSNNGCRDTAEVFVEVSDLDAEFSISAQEIDLAKSPGAVRFTDHTVAATSWLWDFGNGSSSKEKNPLHIFQEPGTYTVQLAVSNGICQSRTSRKLIVKNSSNLEELVGDDIIKVTERTSDGIIQVEMDLPRAMTLTMHLLDNANQQLATGQLRLKAGPYRQQLSLAAFPKGEYQFKLTDVNDKERVWKIVYGG
ncbi:MAG: PKD domain-containing protein [Bacteroidota bacterium]